MSSKGVRVGTNDAKMLYDVARLAAYALHDVAAPVEWVQTLDVKAIMALAARHQMDGIAAMALKAAGIQGPDLDAAEGNALRTAVLFEAERQAVQHELDEAGIWYLPLKGAAIAKHYPRMGMRQSCDVDLLYDPARAQDVRHIMEARGFTTQRFGKGCEDIYHKRPVYNFEMHRMLFYEGNGTTLAAYYQDPRRLMRPDGHVATGFHLSRKDQYVYVVAHTYKHYSHGGTGLRSAMDVYVLRQGETLDEEYVSRELAACGTWEFERDFSAFAHRLFGTGELTEHDWQVLGYLASSGAYGTVRNRAENQVLAYGGGTRGKVRYVLRRLFPSLSSIAAYSPVFVRYKILLPLYPFWHVAWGLTHRKDKVQSEIRYLIKRNDA